MFPINTTLTRLDHSPHPLRPPALCLTSGVARGCFVCVDLIHKILIVCIEKVVILKEKVLGLCSALLALVDRCRSWVWRDNMRAQDTVMVAPPWRSLPLFSIPSFAHPPLLHCYFKSLTLICPLLSLPLTLHSPFLLLSIHLCFFLRLKSGMGPLI